MRRLGEGLMWIGGVSAPLSFTAAQAGGVGSITAEHCYWATGVALLMLVVGFFVFVLSRKKDTPALVAQGNDSEAQVILKSPGATQYKIRKIDGGLHSLPAPSVHRRQSGH